MSFLSINNFTQKLLNAQLLKRKIFVSPGTVNSLRLAVLLKEMGFIIGFSLFYVSDRKFIKIFLKYKNGFPALKSIRVISKPSKRIYLRFESIVKFNPNGGVLILHTNKGLLTDSQCKNLGIGGEPILFIF